MYKLMSIALLCVLTLGLLAADTPAPVVQTEAGKKALAKIRQFGGLALELAQNDPHLEVSYIQTDGKFNDEYLAVLKDLKGLVHLDLRSQPVTDAQLAHLKPLTELTHLHLEKTKITDKGLENLKGLVNLEYLNLYGTAVSDAGLANLEGMKKLKHLYVWQTKVTESGAAKLKQAIPGVDVNLGFKLEPEPKIVAKADPKKDDKKPAPKKEEKKTEAKKDDKKDKKAEAKKEEKKPAPVKDTKTADEVTAILKARVALAEKAYHESWEELGRTQRVGNVLILAGKPEDVYTWSVRWVRALGDLGPKHEEQIAALEAHLKRMTELHKRVKMLSKDLLQPRAESEAEWYRLEAQLWLTQAKAKQANAKQASAK